VDFLVEETKKLSKEVKMLNKAVRNYEVYRLLEEALKAMLTSLPLVQVRARGGPCLADAKLNRC
jgi:dynein heavy chain